MNKNSQQSKGKAADKPIINKNNAIKYTPK